MHMHDTFELSLWLVGELLDGGLCDIIWQFVVVVHMLRWCTDLIRPVNQSTISLHVC